MLQRSRRASLVQSVLGVLRVSSWRKHQRGGQGDRESIDSVSCLPFRDVQCRLSVSRCWNIKYNSHALLAVIAFTLDLAEVPDARLQVFVGVHVSCIQRCGGTQVFPHPRC